MKDMNKITFQADHKEFIKKFFSEKFILKAHKRSKLFLRQLFQSNLILAKKGKQTYPSALLIALNNTFGDQNPELDYELFILLNKLELSSIEILSIIISDLITTEERGLDRYLDYYSQQNDDVKAVSIEDMFSGNLDHLPYHLIQKITTMFYNLASEFDISDGKLLYEDYNEKIDYYIDLSKYNSPFPC